MTPVSGSMSNSLRNRARPILSLNTSAQGRPFASTTTKSPSFAVELRERFFRIPDRAHCLREAIHELSVALLADDNHCPTLFTMHTISGFARRQYFHGLATAFWLEIAVV